MENPFIITGRIKPEYFCDRQTEARRIITEVTQGENIVLMAARRVGKSKLIGFCLERPAIKDEFTTISIDILRTSSIHEFAFELGKAVFESAASRGQKMMKMVVNTLKSINRCFGYDPISNMPTFNLSLGDISNPLYTLDEVFSCLEQSDRRCIVAIDEFQQIANYPEKNMESILRTYVQKCSNANFIFSGSERHLITQMFTERARPFYNSADMMNLDVIPIDKYLDFSTRLFSKFDKQVSEDAVGLAYDTFAGNTYYMQKVLHEAFNQTDVNGVADESMVKAIIHSLVLDNDHKFSEMLSRLTLPQKELLYAIAKEGVARQITSSAFIKKHNLRSASSIQNAAKRLLEYHLISTSQGTYYIDDQLMKLWLNE